MSAETRLAEAYKILPTCADWHDFITRCIKELEGDIKSIRYLKTGHIRIETIDLNFGDSSGIRINRVLDIVKETTRISYKSI